MPAYKNNPLVVIPEMIPGVPVYLFGSYSVDRSNLRLQVQSVALTSNVVTVTGLVVEGAPSTLNFTKYVGSTISLSQTQTAGGFFNVNRATVVSISYNSTTNVATVTFALTGSNVSVATDAGIAIIDTPEVPEVLANGASQAFAVLTQPAKQNGDRTFAVDVSFPGGLPTAVTVSFQVALHNIDSDFATINTVTEVTGGAYVTGFSNIAQFQNTSGNYFRVLVSGLSGTANVICKVLS